MIKNLTPVGDNPGAGHRTPILEMLDIDRQTPLEVRTDGGMPIIGPQRANRQARLQEAAGRMMNAHDGTLRKLAECVRTLINATPIRPGEGPIRSVVVTLQELAPLDEIDRMRTEFLSLVRASVTRVPGYGDNQHGGRCGELWKPVVPNATALAKDTPVKADEALGPETELIFFDTNEMLKPGPRKLHAAWREVHGRHVWLPPTVVTELMPRSGQVYIDGDSRAASRDAERHWKQAGQRVRARMRSEAWWEAVLNDPGAPYRTLRLNEEQEGLKDDVLQRIDPRAFPNIRPDSILYEKDAHMIAETVVLGGRLLLTSNMRSIDHERVNEWTERHGGNYGGHGRAVVESTDRLLCHWLTSRLDDDRMLQAALVMTSEHGANDSGEWISRTVETVMALTRDSSHQLHDFGKVLVTRLSSCTDPVGLAARAAARTPSATIETDRQHPNHPAAAAHPDRPGMPEWYRKVEAETSRYR